MNAPPGWKVERRDEQVCITNPKGIVCHEGTVDNALVHFAYVLVHLDAREKVRRESIAKAMAQGLVSDCTMRDSAENFALVAIRLADELIRQLDREPQEQEKDDATQD